jgi:hypothetical protein
VKPADVSKYFSQPAKEEQGTSFDVIGKGSRPPEPRSVERPSTEAKPTALQESNSMLQVSSLLSFTPSAIRCYRLSCFDVYLRDLSAQWTTFFCKCGVSSVLTTICASGSQGDTSVAKGYRGF